MYNGMFKMTVPTSNNCDSESRSVLFQFTMQVSSVGSSNLLPCDTGGIKICRIALTKRSNYVIHVICNTLKLMLLVLTVSTDIFRIIKIFDHATAGIRRHVHSREIMMRYGTTVGPEQFDVQLITCQLGVNF